MRHLCPAALVLAACAHHEPDGGQPGADAALQGLDNYAGHPLFDNTTMVSWNGRICDDGRYQLVTKLATDLGTSVSGANNRNQLAIYGQL